MECLRGEHVSPRFPARALRDIGVNDLQTVQNRQPGEIEDTLRPLSGFDTRSIRLLLMYLGGKDFVRGDFYLRRYVACALGRKTISSSRTESLVQKAAHELILAPRYLDYAIWRFVLSLEAANPGQPFLQRQLNPCCPSRTTDTAHSPLPHRMVSHAGATVDRRPPQPAPSRSSFPLRCRSLSRSDPR